MSRKYVLPDFIDFRKCSQEKYLKWLQGRARAHVKRDAKRKPRCTVAQYKETIHEAVIESRGRDHYTGLMLDWSLLGTYSNDEARIGRSKNKKDYPSVDHTFDKYGKRRFVICSWKMNDAKSDLTLNELYELCELILKHRDERKIPHNR